MAISSAKIKSTSDPRLVQMLYSIEKSAEQAKRAEYRSQHGLVLSCLADIEQKLALVRARIEEKLRP